MNQHVFSQMNLLNKLSTIWQHWSDVLLLETVCSNVHWKPFTMSSKKWTPYLKRFSCGNQKHANLFASPCRIRNPLLQLLVSDEQSFEIQRKSFEQNNFLSTMDNYASWRVCCIADRSVSNSTMHEILQVCQLQSSNLYFPSWGFCWGTYWETWGWKWLGGCALVAMSQPWGPLATI